MEESNALAPLLRLPGELILHILSFLAVQEVLTLRQTCTILDQVTRSRSLWLSLLNQQQENLPLPPSLYPPVNFRAPSEPFFQLLTPYLEVCVTNAYRIARSWPQPRTGRPTRLTPKFSDSLLNLEVFLDRWLLCAYSEGLVCLWDLGASVMSSVRQTAKLNLRSKNWSSMTAALCPSSAHVVLALTRASTPPMTKIFRVQLRDPGSIVDPDMFELVHTVVSPFARVARSIEPTLKLMVFSNANAVEVVAANLTDVPSLPNANGKGFEKRMSISTQTDDLDELLNGIIASRIMGPYVVLFKSRSIEMHPMDTSICHDLPAYSSRDDRVLKHQFASMTFRSLTSSDCVLTERGLSFSFLGYDFFQGIFYFNVSVLFAPSLPEVASLDVICAGIYPMAENINMESLFPPPSSNLTAGITPTPPSLPASAPTVTQSPHMGIFSPSSGLTGANDSSRGFVSAMALGPQGKRAVWIERKRGSLVREVLVWNRVSGLDDDGDGGMVMPRHVVYCVKSYDLREDLTHCAIGEVSGRIILGNRAGEILVLEADY